MISVRGETYDKVRDYCENKEFSIAHFVDSLCTEFLAGRTDKSNDELEAKEGKEAPLFDPEDLRKLRMR